MERSKEIVEALAKSLDQTLVNRECPNKHPGTCVHQIPDSTIEPYRATTNALTQDLRLLYDSAEVIKPAFLQRIDAVIRCHRDLLYENIGPIYFCENDVKRMQLPEILLDQLHEDIAPEEAKRKLITSYIRIMEARDIPEVLDIENKSSAFPCTTDDFLPSPRAVNFFPMVSEYHEKIIALMVFEAHETYFRALNFAVHKEYRRRGIGSTMVQYLAKKLSPQKRTRILLDVRETNLPGQLFFRSCGFRAIKVLRDFYGDTDEGAYHMRREGQESEVVGSEVTRKGD